jgi:hypothetical protein
MNAAQLKGDLNHIEGAVDRADVPPAVKRLMKEILEWNRGLVDQAVAGAERIDELERDVDGLIEGVSEGISSETAQVILTALEQSRHVCATVAAFVESDKNTLDDVTTKSLALLIRGCAKSVAVAVETVQGIVVEAEEEEEEPDGDVEIEEVEDEEEPDEDGEEDEEGSEEAEEDARG